MMPADREIVRRALRDALPLFAPIIPFGLVFGLAVTESGINHFLGWSSSWLIFAGAAQLTLISLLGSGTAAGAAIMAAVVVNARHVMYSAGLAPTFKNQPTWFRWLAPYVLVDQVFAQASLHLDDAPRDFRVYYLALGSVFWIGWQTATAAGLFIGPIVPAELNLGFAAPILFIGIVVLGIDTRPKLVAAVVGAAVTWLTAGLPNRSGLLVGAIAGILAGTIAERVRR
jgi:predicted branched-subunit amino acid permease